MEQVSQFSRWMGPSYALERSVCSFTRLISQGDIDVVVEDFTEANFSPPGPPRLARRVSLFHYGQAIGTPKLCRLLAGNRVRLATPLELLAFTAQASRAQLAHSVLSLSQNWRSPEGPRYVPMACLVGGRRAIRLVKVDGEWAGGYRILISHLD